jgi:6,7-dimethyl-8-ribityllumazine synthase
MPRVLEGSLLLTGDESFAIVVSRFNDLITQRLLEGALDTIRRHGGNLDRVTVVWVPGSYEIPLAADRLAMSGEHAAVICLGAVIQGETSHHESINIAVANGVMQAGLSTQTPVLFGVLACHNMDQALDRAGGKVGNKGIEATLAAIEMVNLLKQLPAPQD